MRSCFVCLCDALGCSTILVMIDDLQVDSDPINTPDLTGVESHNLLAALSYLGVLVVIPLWLVESPNNFVRFHARQGLLVFIGVVLSIIAGRWVAIVGNMAWLLFALLSVIGFIQALLGKWWKIPVLGDIAEKISV